MAGILLVSGSGFAQSADEQRARADALFREGQSLVKAGQIETGCAKLEESHHIDPKLGRLLNVAFCHEQLGRSATAWSEYNQAAALAVQQRQADREEFARKKATELAAKLSFVRIDLSAAPDVDHIEIDGHALTRDQWSVPQPIDPGAHSISFSGQGRKTRTESITIAGTGTTRINVDPLESATPSAAAPSPAPTLAPTPSTTPPTPAPAPAPAPDRTLAYVVGGAGIVAIAAGTYFALHAMSLKSDADPQCPNKVCTPAGTDLIDSAKTSASIATIGFGVGVAALAVGTWMALRAGPTAPRTGLRVVPALDARGGSLRLEAAW